MNNEFKDSGLKKAVKETSQFRLPSNFTYHTMKKVEEGILIREKKAEKGMLFAIIAASLFLLGFCGAGLYFYASETIANTFIGFIASFSKYDFKLPSIYCMVITFIPLFFLFDQWMRKEYFKHHNKP